MKNFMLTVILCFPLVLIAQESSDRNRADARSRYEKIRQYTAAAVERGDITEEEGRERMLAARKRLFKDRTRIRNDDQVSDTGSGIDEHYARLGISDMSRVKNLFKENGMTESQMGLVLRMMIRVIHTVNTEGDEFQLGKRFTHYFENDVGLTGEQVQLVERVSKRLAGRSR